LVYGNFITKYIFIAGLKIKVVKMLASVKNLLIFIIGIIMNIIQRHTHTERDLNTERDKNIEATQRHRETSTLRKRHTDTTGRERHIY